MNPNSGPGRRVVWLGVAGLVLVPLAPLSAQQPTLRATLTGHDDKVYSVAFHPGGRILASGSTDGTVKLWDVASGKNTATLRGHTDRVFSVAFSPDGRILATGAGRMDNSIKLWDIPAAKPVGR
jgi:WD40 repeat protein